MSEAERSTNPTDLGSNRTGAQRAPMRNAELAECTDVVPGAQYNPMALAVERAEFSREAPPIGTMPIPARIKGVAKAALQALEGKKASVFLDRLGDRLAFERAGVRLYEAMMAKLPAADLGEGSLTAAEVRHFHDEELAHFQLLRETIERLGGDPTVVTPCADLVGVQGIGLLQVMTDPRTTLTQCLDALLTAELSDNEGWRILVSMATAAGQVEMASRFGQALLEEDEHLSRVRIWIQERLGFQLGAELPETPSPV